MLTRDDLEQIRGVFKNEMHVAIQEEVRGIVREEIQYEIGPIKKNLAVVTHKVNRLQKDITLIVHDYSNAISGLRKRVERIEDHLDLPQV